MRLNNPNLAPVGGWQFRYKITPTPRYPEGLFVYVNNQASNTSHFIRLVVQSMMTNQIPVPENIGAIVEDYICSYQPEGRCNYNGGFGDKIAQVVHTVTRAVDRVAGTDLTKAAKGCPGCAKRRMALNKKK